MKARHLAELAALKSTLQRARYEAAQARAREHERQARERHEQELFSRTVGEVVPLREAGAPRPPRARPEPRPRQRELDEAAVLQDSISDEFDVESLLDTDESLSFRRHGIGPEVVRKLRRGSWAIQAQVDLHGLRRDDARERLAQFLRNAVRDGVRCVRVVHGRGNGSPGRVPVLKGKVRGWLVQKNEVLAFTQASAGNGGQGAVLVLLRAVEPAAAARRPDSKEIAAAPLRCRRGSTPTS